MQHALHGHACTPGYWTQRHTLIHPALPCSSLALTLPKCGFMAARQLSVDIRSSQRTGRNGCLVTIRSPWVPCGCPADAPVNLALILGATA